MSFASGRAPVARVNAVFPGGFDAKFGPSSSSGLSYNSAPLALQPIQLYELLVEKYKSGPPMETIIVKSAWYGKQTKGARHEFIVVQVEDTGIPGLINYLILERTSGVPSGSKAASSQRVAVVDEFKVSYNGNCEKLLKKSGLTPYRFLEELSFQTKAPLHCYELVTLASVTSRRYPYYQLPDLSCYLFAGVIWDCMFLLCPSAKYRSPLATKQGKYRCFRDALNTSEKEVTFKEVKNRLPQIEMDLWGEIRLQTSQQLGEDAEQYMQ
ncbi:hypothetical protein BDV93DRAFT_514127 [Ceratobasidium sp. AG-I]|nr:hypothetical protein BDV93DRAFT_514127 [Ceratobasidium sp. AG-I]